eukprot:1929795-Amphidinium_carterae.2
MSERLALFEVTARSVRSQTADTAKESNSTNVNLWVQPCQMNKSSQSCTGFAHAGNLELQVCQAEDDNSVGTIFVQLLLMLRGIVQFVQMLLRVGYGSTN